MQYILQKEKKRKKIQQINLSEGFHMKPKLNSHPSLISIKEIILVEEKLKNNVIQKQFNRTFRRLIAMIIDVTESDNTTSSDCIMALNEITKTMSIIEKKYQKALKKNEYMKMQKKLLLLENKIKEKLIQIRMTNMAKKLKSSLEKEENKERGR